jgi:hypothetical protein
MSHAVGDLGVRDRPVGTASLYLQRIGAIVLRDSFEKELIQRARSGSRSTFGLHQRHSLSPESGIWF